jgi:tetratricopeptide (TPR) repeat protein
LCLFGLAQSAAAQGSDHVGQAVVRVRDTHSESSLERACVQLIRFPEQIVSEQFTGSDGGVQFSGIGVGAYIIRATRAGYQPGEARVDFRKGDATVQNVDIPLLPVDNDVKAGPGGTVATEALRVPENARKEFDRGRRLLNEKKNPRESIVAFQRAITLHSDYADAYFLLGSAQMLINEAAAAEDSLRKAIAIDARRTAPYYPLAMLLFSQRRFDDEQQLLLAVNTLDPADWRWPFELARCAAQQGQWETALQHALEASKNASAPTRVHLMLADIYANSDRPRDAVAELELFAQLDPRSAYMERVHEVLPVLRQRAASSAPSPH